MKKHFSAAIAVAVSLFGISQSVSGALVSSSGTAPATAVISQPDFSAASFNGGQDFTDNAGPPAQLFTTGATGFLLDKVTVKGFANTGGSFGNFTATTTWTLTVSTVASNVLTNIAQESSQGFAPTDGSAYITIDLDTPVPLLPNTQYAFAVHTSAGYFGLAKSSTDVLTGGSAIQYGTVARSASSGAIVGNVQAVDRTFFIAAVPEPASVALLGTACLGLLARRRRI